MTKASFQAAAAEDLGKQLLRAVLRGDLVLTQQLLDDGAPANFRNASQHTPLMIAVSQGNFPMAELLLAAKADPNVLAADGMTPLMAAKNAQMMECLLAHGADPLAGKPALREMLMRTAARFGNTQVFDAMFGAGVNPGPDDGGKTILMHALEGDNTVIVASILKMRPDINEKDRAGRTAMIHAATFGSGNCLQLLLNAGASATEEYQSECTPLQLQAEKGSETGVEVLLKAGAKVHPENERDSSNAPLRAAIRGGNVKCVRMIAEAGADPLNKAWDTEFKVSTTDEELAAKVGGEIADIVSEAAKKYLLIEAAAVGDAKKVTDFLEQGAPVDFVNRKHETALLRASVAGQIETATILLAHGANPNFTNLMRNGKPILAAIQRDDPKVFEALLVHGAQMDHLRGKNGEPPLFAVLEMQIKFVDILLKYGADPNAVFEEDGRTALYRAIQKTDISLVEHLLEGGATVNMKDKGGLTPVELARKSGDEHIYGLMREQYQKEMAQLAESATSLKAKVTPLRAIKFRPAGNS